MWRGGGCPRRVRARRLTYVRSAMPGSARKAVRISSRVVCFGLSTGGARGCPHVFLLYTTDYERVSTSNVTAGTAIDSTLSMSHDVYMIRMSRPAGGRGTCQCEGGACGRPRWRSAGRSSSCRTACALWSCCAPAREAAAGREPQSSPVKSDRGRRARAGAGGDSRGYLGVPLSGSNAEAITATLVATRAPPTVIRREAGRPGVLGASGDALHAHLCGTAPSANAVSTMAYALPPGAMSRAPPRGRASHRRPCRVAHLAAWQSRVRVP